MKVLYCYVTDATKATTHIASNLSLLTYPRVTGTAMSASIRQQALNIAWFVDFKVERMS